MKYPLLETIDFPSDLRELPVEKLEGLAVEMRRFIIEAVAAKEGHLGASLGVVELTLALHYAFNTPYDKLIWDVGHQAYGHKIITGRRKVFDTNRQFKGISGFPKMAESEYDAFGTGHSSTSISAALGMAIASRLQGDSKKQHIAVIGDASIASGMAFEALNHAGDSRANILVILNDNAIGIDPSVGALKNYLTQVKTGSQRSVNIFEALNFKYFGPVDGHDIDKLLEIFKTLKKIEGPKFLHVITTKGKGLKQAEHDQVKYHAPGKFDALTGELISPKETPQPPKYQDVFGLTLVELAKKNPKIIGITPAMPTGSSMKYMMQAFPERAFDVGIAEQHAVTLAAGIAASGGIPFCAIYSTFLQRAYDQLIHDVALQKLPVVFCIDRAGLVGEDGATHHGVFDLAYLRCVPNLMIYAPRNEESLRNIMFTVQVGLDFPIAIRYPRGRGTSIDWKKSFKKIEFGKAEKLTEGNELALIVTGHFTAKALRLAESFSGSIAVYYFGFIKPLDTEALHQIFNKYGSILTLEDGVLQGGLASAVAEAAVASNYKGSITSLGIPDEFIEHGSTEELYESIGLTDPQLKSKIQDLLRD
ncbi:MULTISPECIES: 1-deoxy-D-xylulose-5-phosphate synthase [unclassified Leeuwenhoekiella]|uniref:1-deoxy-D-xylulose-5-phosphate synthase n=1 Tax=unclassified Leeuwenhoekiella TaxID=2615029 RepID=UPI000C489592|nr:MULTISPECIES: 1-deoxy-D-xylulose-5-phosphate synthase [unclassified Leeuwenhoekiella]MAS71552.1 1-deoxy-D-xylulose-5-phosphate synthase [Zunongwangia sp.]MAW96291.1 1-deoxy-D-xylulose-5-phosphate synthase [Leeuwenhoekiella sp.]MBA82782.1 1-deoxy-D-xylulose-5-phosphate synthase [Leeuwenhoekiella sp.]|tara:strand:- start:12382 stop:14151 length:1770 start_codon:yes stop_codon:yes gene_type:complete